MTAINHVGYTLAALRKHAKRDGDKLCSITPHEAARLITHYDAIVTAARLVVARWESGDLAEAVRQLDEASAP